MGRCDLPTAANVKSLHIYIQSIATPGTMRLALYESGHSIPLAIGDVFTPVVGWNESPVAVTELTAGTYFVAARFSTDGILFRYESDADVRAWKWGTCNYSTYPDMPDTRYGVCTEGEAVWATYSMHVSYCASTPTPTWTPTITDTPTITATPTITDTPADTATPTATPTPPAPCTVYGEPNFTYNDDEPNYPDFGEHDKIESGELDLCPTGHLSKDGDDPVDRFEVWPMSEGQLDIRLDCYSNGSDGEVIDLNLYRLSDMSNPIASSTGPAAYQHILAPVTNQEYVIEVLSVGGLSDKTYQMAVSFGRD